MKPVINHSWKLSEPEALILQQRLACKVVKKDALHQVNFIAGVDVAYSKDSNKLIAAVVVFDAYTLQTVETSIAEDENPFPYIPGLFSFREIPSLIKAFAKLQHIPDLIVCDGQGYAHPRRFGLACHLGVIFDTPTIGCGKSRLIGNHDELAIERGAISSLIDNHEVIGNVLRTQTNINPIYISIGHRISLPIATEWVLKLSPDYRLPETTRRADQAVRKALQI